MTASRSERRAEARSYAGYRSAAFARQTGTLVVIVQAAEAGIEDDPETPWATICDGHDRVVCHATLAEARYHASDPGGWCEVCAGTEAPDHEDGSLNLDHRYAQAALDTAAANRPKDDTLDDFLRSVGQR